MQPNEIQSDLVPQLTAYSPALIATLETLIAPGRRARLSPYVESAQFRVLFGQHPEPAWRYEHMRQILKENHDRVSALARTFGDFQGQGKQFDAGRYDDELLAMYLAYYLPTNVAKLQLVLLELVRQEKLAGDLRMLDIGVGTGTTALAVLDFCVAWAHVCDLFGVQFPISAVTLTGLDANQRCLAYAGKTVNAYADGLQARIQVRDEASPASDILAQAGHWARQAVWQQFDLEQNQLQPPESPLLIVASNIFNELDREGQSHLKQIITQSPTGSIAIIIEPGDKGRTQALNRWRRSLVNETPQLQVIAPCGAEHPDELPWQCNDCWNARRESFHQPLLYQAFRQASLEFTPDKRSFDNYINNLLSWSYTCLQWAEAVDTSLPAGNGYHRFIGAFTGREPVAYGPDAFKNAGQSGWTEFLKFCPGNYTEYRGVALERLPGFQVPALTHGELVYLNDVEHGTWAAGVLKLSPDSDSEIRPVQAEVDIEQTFFPAYVDQSRGAIDEIAYRLFGFPAMRPFQHEILKRVLTGGNILGIAATGGGKSECFILPSMLLPGITVVVSPLKSLMQDQYDQRISERYGLGHLTTYLNGDVPFRERQARLKRLTLGYYKLIYMTPEQLERGYVLDSLKQANEAVGIRYLAMDEAHCISQWGHDFRASYLNLVRRLRDWGINPVRIALTATASPEVRQDLCEELELNPAPVIKGGDVYVYSSNRHELNLRVHVAQNMNKKSDQILKNLQRLLEYNQQRQHSDAAIVFMPHTGGLPENTWAYLPPPEEYETSKKGKFSAGVTPFASFVERALQHRVAIYHSKMDLDSDDNAADQSSDERPFGDLQDRTRRSEQNAFISGEREIMVATKGFGMGIDKPNIRLVLHRTPPANLEAYAQEAGRAGRDGELSDVVLFYSPDRWEEEDNTGRKNKIQSDYDIQHFFLSEKYIRRQDVIVMRAFLRSVKRRASRHLYFTNDEVIEFFDDCQQNHRRAGLEQPYSWPMFARREQRGRESEDHQQILDRGHLYQEKTSYIDRILSVLYRIRPNLPGVGLRTAFLERVQKTGAQIIRPELRNTPAILQSNAYFGDLLRAKKISAREFNQWVQQAAATDLLGLADYLELPPSETAALFQDIKFADGTFDQYGNWQPALIDFAIIAAPRYGPAAGKEELADWRAYAGARTRANGYHRAKSNGRSYPTINDWFYWKELPTSQGWEALPGPAFSLDEAFDRYLEAFMTLHNQREQNDWAAYRRLLTDYVGVSENGQLRDKPNRNCLRAVMLGYLRTYEVITGDNCLSCSRCVPSGEFEQDLEQRKSVVVSLGSVLVDQLDRLETYSQILPEPELTVEFWQTVNAEQAAGRSVVAYVEGWTGRLLADTPGHRAGLWLRLTGMHRRLITLQPTEFIANIGQLIDLLSDLDLTRLWYELLDTAHNLLPDRPEILVEQARACHRLEDYAAEEASWQRLVSHSQSTSELQHQAHVSLAKLYAPTGPRPAPDLLAVHTLQAARLAPEPAVAMQFYHPLCSTWPWERLQSEIDWWEASDEGPAYSLPLVELWLGPDPTPEKSRLLCRHLVDTQNNRHWPVARLGAILSQIPESVLNEYLPLVGKWLEVQAETDRLFDAPLKFAQTLLEMVFSLPDLTGAAIEYGSRIIFEQLAQDDAIKLQQRYVPDRTRTTQYHTLLASHYTPINLTALNRWLDWFADYLIQSRPVTIVDLLERALPELRHTQTTDDASVRIRYRSFVVQLMRHEEHQNRTHQIWLRFCDLWPVEALPYLELCLNLEPPAPDFIEECLAVFLDQPNLVDQLEQLTSIVERSGRADLPRRLSRFLELHGLINQLTTTSDINQVTKLTPQHFRQIFNTFKPYNSPERADMMAVFIINLRLYLPPAWLTPISYLVQALGLAGRYAEANNLATTYPQLRVGPQQESGQAFLYQLNTEVRQPPTNEDDYHRLIRQHMQSWRLSRGRG